MKKFINLGDAFKYIVNKYSKNIALSYPETGERVNYLELDILVTKIINTKKFHLIDKESVVLILNDKSKECLALMLACLKHGLIYINIDIDMPFERINKIIETSKPSLIIKSKCYRVSKIEGLYIDNLINSEVYDQPSNRIVHGNTPAYIMFTSGSTGAPKGVTISHDNVLNFIEWSIEYFKINENDSFSSVNPIYFDNSVFDFFNSLFTGAKLIIVKASITENAKNYIRFLEEEKCSIWFSVPSLLIYLLTMRVLNKNSLKNIRKIVFGGEGFPKKKLLDVYNIFQDRADLENVYGPTECTCICSAYKISKGDFDNLKELPSLGSLSKYFDFQITSENKKKSNIGELILYGPNVGLGYYNNNHLTNKFFVQRYANNSYKDIGYKTGDIVELIDGKLFFKGRKDYQFKYMGYRIEPGEIENIINLIPTINESAVIYKNNKFNSKMIHAYVASNEKISESYIRSFITDYLPKYMIPKYIYIYKSLPKNKNGKIDKKFLESN